VALAAAAVVGWPSANGGSESLRLVRSARSARPVPAYRVTRQLLRLRPPDRVALLTDLPPPYVHALVSPGAVVAPLLPQHPYQFKPEVFRFGRAERAELVAKSLAEGAPVWAVTHHFPIFGLRAALPAPPGYQWEVMAVDGIGAGGVPAGRTLAGGGIARLVPEESPPEPAGAAPAPPGSRRPPPRR
jgi:hypothetical protein